jgi:hypothetical protein
MASKQPSLFDGLEEEPKPKMDETLCLHLKELRTETVWPGEQKQRLTMTCDSCGRLRGRYPGE